MTSFAEALTHKQDSYASEFKELASFMNGFENAQPKAP